MKKIPSTNLLGAIVRDYFADHLPRLRGSSPHTIHSYRDSIVLLLRFIAEQRKVPLASLDLADLDPPRILAFLSYLEDQRNNGVATRNVRPFMRSSVLWHLVIQSNWTMHRECLESLLNAHRNEPSTIWNMRRSIRS